MGFQCVSGEFTLPETTKTVREWTGVMRAKGLALAYAGKSSVDILGSLRTMRRTERPAV